MLTCSLPVTAEEIMQKGKTTAAPTATPAASSASSDEIEDHSKSNAQSGTASSNKTNKIGVTKSNILKKQQTATPQPTATPVPPTATPAVKSSGRTVVVVNNHQAQKNAAADQIAELKKTWLSTGQYYYQQLSQEHKKAWEDDIANALRYPNQTAVARDVRHQALSPMIKLDNPRIFWVDWIDSNGRLRYETGNVAHMGALQFPAGETLSSLQEDFLAAIPKAVAEIEKKLPANATKRDIAKAIHDWICINNTYNEKQTSAHKGDSDPVSFDYLAAHSAFSAIIPGDKYEPVCEGYAGAFQLLCEEFGLEAISVYGSTKSIRNHVWNYVKLDDGQWYLVDVDADDLASSYHHNAFLLNNKKSTEQGYTPNPYLSSGVNPSNGYTEGAAFTMPQLAK